MRHILTVIFFLFTYPSLANLQSSTNLIQWCHRRSYRLETCDQQASAWCNANPRRLRTNQMCIEKFSQPSTEVRPRRQDQPQRDAPMHAEKADVRMLNRIQDGMNGFAQKFVEQGLRALASPIMQALKQAPNAERTYSELAINDPAQYFQADLDLTKFQAAEIIRGFLPFINGRRVKRKVGRMPSYDRWESFPIPYQFASSISQSSRVKIKQAIKLWEANTCVRFQENGGGQDRIEFTDGGGCSSFVGRAGGTQDITLNQPGCMYVGIISHEIGHALGFFHEQNRPDQKENVNINFDSINPARYNNFVAQKPSEVNNYDVPYDFGSVMHYDPRVKSFQLFSFFASDYVILAKDANYQNTMGQRKAPSFADYLQINRAYCEDKCSRTIGCKYGGYENPNNCALCKCPSGFGGAICGTVEQSPCGGVLSAVSTRQSLTSPGYPSQFSVGSRCVWHIDSPPGSRVMIRVNDLDFKCKDTCDANYLEVKPGNWQKTGYRLCCKKPDDTITSAGNKMVIIFSGMDSPSSKGFQLEYWTDARGVVAPTTTTAIATRGPQPPPGGQSTTTTTPIPSTFAPGEDCPCAGWSAWSECDYDCGGCGYTTRQRTCRANKPENCETTEKKHCNFDACGDQKGPVFRNGKFNFFYDGCCLGLVKQNDQCLTVSQSFTSGISKVFGNFFGNNNGRK